MPKVSFDNRQRPFYSSLQTTVEEYFKRNHLRKTGNHKLYLKTFTLVPAAIFIYCSLLFFHYQPVVGILISGLFGFVLASIGFNVMHDACHGSYSGRHWVNHLMGYSLNALGGNAFFWKFKHNIIHHTYPNIDGIDDDIAKSPLMRMCSTQKWVPLHKFQHIYVVFVYAITSFAWILITDFAKYFQQKLEGIRLQKMNIREHLIFWISKILYFFFYIALPVYVAGWQKWAIGFVSFHLVLGFTLAIVFQLAHVVEPTVFDYAGSSDPVKIENEWAVYQVKATADFATRNKIISWFVGGLNFQIEHHLFPRISHVHYPALHKIVKQKCLQYHIAHNEFPTMSKAIQSHFSFMKKLGKKPS